MKTISSWEPSKQIIQNSNIFKMMHELGIDNYQDFREWSIQHKATFWENTIHNLEIKLASPYSEFLDISKGNENARWMKNATLNIVDSCFQNTDDSIAIRYQKNNETIKDVSQFDLQKLVNKIANGLLELGLKSGDKIAIDMPMTLEAVAIYLAGIKAGMPIVTIADSFTPNEIESRLKITKPKIIFTQDVIHRAGKEIPMYAKIVEANGPKTIVVHSSKNKCTLRKKDVSWEIFLSHKSTFKSVIQNPDDIITILFSSGTTGNPKAIPWTHLTPVKSASDGYYHHDIHKNDIICWPTNLGWMMGPWLVFASLINKATIALFYGTPTDEAFGGFVQDAEVTMLGVIPSFVKQWKNTKCMEAYNWDAVKCFSSTGEVSNPTEMAYLMKLANNKPIIEYCGGTEIGGGYVASTVVQPNYPSTFSTQTLGGEFVLLNEDNKTSTKGELFLIPPILGLSNTLLNKNHYEVYYKGTPTYKNQMLRRHGDELQQLENGYYKALGRVDDAINLGGIKVSPVQIEAVLNNLSFIKECAAIAISQPDGGPNRLLIYYVEKKSALLKIERINEINKAIKTKLNPLFKVFEIKQIDKLPRTASNKIMRRTLRNEY